MLPLSTKIFASAPILAPCLKVKLAAVIKESVSVAESIFVTVIFPNVTLPGIVALVKSTVPVNVLVPAILWFPVVLITVLSTANSPLVTPKPSPAVKCALTSAALGPVYVNVPSL